MSNAARRNGKTSVSLSTDLTNALSSLGVQASGFGNTTIQDGVANFLVTGGSADLENTAVEIIHSGGLTFRAGTTEVSLTDFIISNLDGQTTLTGLVLVNGELVTRAPLFDLEIGSVGTSRRRRRPNLDIDDVEVSLSDAAADVLNQAFGVTAFEGGFNIGTATVDARFNRNGNISDRLLPVRDFLGDDTSLFPGATADVLPTGRTSVELSDSLTNALGALNVEARGFRRTRIRNGVADFLITGGAADLDTTEVEIIHRGGLRLRAGRTRVDLTDFVISNVNQRTFLTGTVSVNGVLGDRIRLFRLGVGDVSASQNGQVTDLDLTNVEVTLAGRAARTLNRAFDVDAFTRGFDIGTAEVDASVV
ncbi:MAG: hypothetical protein AAFQ57_08335 [Cyanobacteria bacterium J06626_14]